ncbi:MAG: dual specificity protein phosphatase family protein [Phycisphaerae bacterium]|jgi:protein tyrosine phosphatase (PTP) superfamily phosphohydrolase (DUF442 family)
MAKKKNPVIGWLWIAAIVLLAVVLVKHFYIKNFQVIKPGVLYTSGQPRGMDYTRLLYKYHIAAFVNVRKTDEHREQNWHNEEVAWMKSHGVTYIELPIDKDVADDGIPDLETSGKFLEIMDERANIPVLLHDNTGKKRVSYLAAVWMLKSGGFNLDKTVEKIKQLKGQPLNEQEMEFLRSLVP